MCGATSALSNSHFRVNEEWDWSKELLVAVLKTDLITSLQADDGLSFFEYDCFWKQQALTGL